MVVLERSTKAVLVTALVTFVRYEEEAL